MISFFSDIENRIIGTVDYPFLVFHDVEDEVVSVESTRELLKKSRTSDGDKEAIFVNDGRHDLMQNIPSIILERSLPFITKRLAKVDEAKKLATLETSLKTVLN